LIFRDLKPENILLNKDMHIQITDFGSAKILSKEDQTKPEEGNYYHVFFSLCSCFSCQLKLKYVVSYSFLRVYYLFLDYLAKCHVTFCHHLAYIEDGKFSHLNHLTSLEPLIEIKPNLAAMILGWFPFKSVSDSPTLHSRWLP
jgi:serine/threonine protein kinase